MKPLVILMLFPILVYGQDTSRIETFKMDTMKDGFHVHVWKDHRRFEFYTVKGKVNGFCKEYYENGELQKLYYKKNDTLSGNAYWFNQNGRIFFTEENIQLDEPGGKYKASYKAYNKLFDDNGKITAEGPNLFFDDEDLYLGDDIKYGKWKYYDGGVLTSEEEYKNGVLFTKTEYVNGKKGIIKKYDKNGIEIKK
jgi:antitoxin component YwqK of YwqJK toxin-antitoxin module